MAATDRKEIVICERVTAYDDGSVVISQTPGHDTVCKNWKEAEFVFSQLLRLYSPKLVCECQDWDAGGGEPWLCAFGIFGKDAFERWRRGDRGFHHPLCMKELT